MKKEKLIGYINLMRLNKPIGILLLLWPTITALWIANFGPPDTKIILVFTLGVIIMRSAGCIINDLADMNFDGHVKRTNNRPLVTKSITKKEAIYLFVFLIFLAFILALQLNNQAIMVSFIALLLASIYPFTKRFFNAPQLFLGLAFSVSIPMGFVSSSNYNFLVMSILFLSNLLWTIAYDTQYAMVDKEDDIKIGINSTAILFGKADIFIVPIFQIISLVLLYLVGLISNFGSFYYCGIFISSIFILYQMVLIRERKPKNCFKSFLNNNYIGLCIFLGVFLEFLLK